MLYQVYLRSFADSDGDGVGDLGGVCERLEYLEWLGVDAIWLSPVTISPDADWGYDVADYTDVQPVLGGMAALDELYGLGVNHYKELERDVERITVEDVRRVAAKYFLNQPYVLALVRPPENRK